MGLGLRIILGKDDWFKAFWALTEWTIILGPLFYIFNII